jgi:hypothetical protein
MTLSESLRKIADQLEKWDGKANLHTDEVKSVEELKAWTHFLEKPRLLMHTNGAYNQVYGNVGPSVQVFVKYPVGMLGEAPRPKLVQVPKQSEEAALKRLQEILA